MIRNSGVCARCGKSFETSDGDTYVDRNYGRTHGKLVHSNYFVCITALYECAEELKVELEETREHAHDHELALQNEIAGLQSRLAACEKRQVLTLTDRGDSAEGVHAVYADGSG